MDGPRAQGEQLFPSVCVLSVTGSASGNAGLILGLGLRSERVVLYHVAAESEAVNSSSRTPFLHFSRSNPACSPLIASESM